MAKKLKQPSFAYGGQTLNLSKSTKEAAVLVQKGALLPPDAQSSTSRSIDNFAIVSASRNMDAKLDKLRALKEVQMGSHVYYVNDEKDVPFIPTGRIYIEFLSDTDTTKHYAVFEKWHLTVLEVVFPGAYRVQVTPDSPNPIKCVMALQKLKGVQIAEPEFATIPVECDFDVPRGSFSLTQWHLENTGSSIPIVDIPNAIFGTSHFRKGADAKVNAAWRFMNSLGSKNIKIAVIDTGFDVEHPMLYGDGTKIRAPYNARERSSDASPYFTYADGTMGVYSHGTSCAAVAAGYLQNGIIGAAPNAKIIPIRLDVLSDEAIKNAFEHAFLNGADVISCSLGYPKPVPLSTYITNYLRHVALNGRNGKGISMFFAAGNANPASNNVPRQISDFAAHPSSCCITASNSLDESSTYSFYGPNALICAPTNGNDGVGITTAHVELLGGGLDHTYTSGFGGTSSATPLVAGVAALMLSVNPNLTASEIKNILRNNADKINTGYDSSGHSAYLGYGRINALKAVKAAHLLAQGGTNTGTTTPPPVGPTPPPTTPAPVERRRGVVVSQFLNIRSQPSLTATKVGKLNNGDTVDIFETVGGLWYRIGNGMYVHKDYIRLTATQLRTGRVTSATLNVRNGPSTANTRLRQLKLNDKIVVQEATPDGWFRIGQGEWVFGYYIRLD
jgi:subtilisin family serine protease